MKHSHISTLFGSPALEFIGLKSTQTNVHWVYNSISSLFYSPLFITQFFKLGHCGAATGKPRTRGWRNFLSWHYYDICSPSWKSRVSSWPGFISFWKKSSLKKHKNQVSGWILGKWFRARLKTLPTHLNSRVLLSCVIAKLMQKKPRYGVPWSETIFLESGPRRTPRV